MAEEKDMQKFINQNKVYLLTWCLLLAYLPFAHTVYAKFFLPLSDGYPLIYEEKLPSETKKIAGDFGKLTHVEKGLYRLSGWAFFKPDPDSSHFKRWVILQSDVKTYLFPITMSTRQIEVDISKEFIQPGSYQIGLLFKNKRNQSVYYKTTSQMLVHTTNDLKIKNAKKK